MPVSLVAVPPELINLQPDLATWVPGLAHGTLFESSCSETRQGIRAANVPENRRRFAKLVALFTWTMAQDHQLYYAATQPELVFSFDHGHFLPGGPNLSIALAATTSRPLQLDTYFDACRLTPDELRAARHDLLNVTFDQLATAVASPPEDWSLTMADRVVLAEFLRRRRAQVARLM